MRMVLKLHCLRLPGQLHASYPQRYLYSTHLLIDHQRQLQLPQSPSLHHGLLHLQKGAFLGLNGFPLHFPSARPKKPQNS